jgi:hypothetical protein
MERVSSRHERRTRWRAQWLYIVHLQLGPLRCELIKGGSRHHTCRGVCSGFASRICGVRLWSSRSGLVVPHVIVTKIVSDDHENIGLHLSSSECHRRTKHDESEDWHHRHYCSQALVYEAGVAVCKTARSTACQASGTSSAAAAAAAAAAAPAPAQPASASSQQQPERQAQALSSQHISGSQVRQQLPAAAMYMPSAARVPAPAQCSGWC